MTIPNLADLFFAATAHAHFGREGIGSAFSGTTLRIVDSLTWIGIVICITMVVLNVQKRKQT